MPETPEGGALHRRGSGVEGVDFDHPAEAVLLVGEGGVGEVEAAVEALPAIDRSAAFQPVSRLPRVRRPVAAGAEIEVEVLLAGQPGSPRRAPVGAIVERARGRRAVRRSEQAGGGPGDGDRRVDVDAPREAARRGAPTPERGLFDLHDPGADGVLRRAHIVEAFGHGLAEQMGVAAELEIDGEKPAPAAVEGEERHPVMAGPHLPRPVGGGRRVAESRPAGGDRVAPGDQHAVSVVGRDRGVRPAAAGARQGAEVDAGRRVLRGRGAAQPGAKESDRRRAAAERRAARNAAGGCSPLFHCPQRTAGNGIFHAGVGAAVVGHWIARDAVRSISVSRAGGCVSITAIVSAWRRSAASRASRRSAAASWRRELPA